MIYTFGNYKLDTLQYELYDDGHLSKLNPRTLEILTYLIEHREHVVSREELVENLWPGHIISEGAINNCIKKARKAIGDSGDGQNKIRTIHGRGYRFVAEMLEHNAVTPMFREPKPHDSQAPVSPVRSSAVPTSTSQNVFVGDYAFATVLCGALENLEGPREDLGFEVSQNLRQTFFTLAQEEAEQHDGTFKFFGSDGFLMFFGLPVVHADHVSRAVRAGLRLQDRLQESYSVFETPGLIGVTVQMGLHTGLIEISSKRDNMELVSPATSETTALAIRLHYLAKGGKFLTSKAAIAHVQERVKWVEHSAIPMLGHPQPIMAYRICGLATS